MTAPGTVPDRPWHALALAEVTARLATGAAGLASNTAGERLVRFGRNELPRAKPRSLVVVYLRQFTSSLVYLLAVAAAVSLAVGKGADALFIFGVLQVNAIIGTVQEWKAELSARALDRMVTSTATVIRDGRHRRVEAAELVPGDVVVIEPGARIGADLRLTEADGLLVDESLLTGESMPVDKAAAESVPEDASLGDRVNMLHAGTTVLRGNGRGVVVATGARTEIGRIAESLTHAGGEPPLLRRLRRFTNVITAVFAVVIVILAGIEFLHGTPLLEIFLTSVALAVAAVPEGLPVAITVALAIATARMARRNVVVRLLPAVEGLGACTLIASDKTGTLTLNELTARRLWLPDGAEAEVTGTGYRPEGQVLVSGAPAAGAVRAEIEALVAAALMSSEAELYHTADVVTHYGDTVDVAFIALGHKLGLHRAALATGAPRVALLPFDAERRLAASFNRLDSVLVAHVKGAAEKVVPLCAGVDTARVRTAEEALAAAGYRVLAVARGPVAISGGASDPGADGLRDLTFLGLVGFIDPVRPEAPDAVRDCRSAGIDVRMVTGDHPVTARAIAHELGMLAPGRMARASSSPERSSRRWAKTKLR